MLYLSIAIAIIYVISLLSVIRLLTKYFWKCSITSIFKDMDFTSFLFLFVQLLNTAVALVGISELIKDRD